MNRQPAGSTAFTVGLSTRRSQHNGIEYSELVGRLIRQGRTAHVPPNQNRALVRPFAATPVPSEQPPQPPISLTPQPWYEAKGRLLKQFPKDARQFLKHGTSRQSYQALNVVRQDLQLLESLSRLKTRETIMNPFLRIVKDLIDSTLTNEIQENKFKGLTSPHASQDSAKILLDTIHSAVHAIMSQNLWKPASVHHFKTLIRLADGQNAERYLNLFWTLNYIRPDRFDYTSVLEKYRNEGNPEACTKMIESWWKKYHECDKHLNLKPTEKGYTHWLVSLSCKQANAAAEAKATEDALRTICERQALDDYTPGVTLYNAVMHAYGKARDPENAERVFHEMCVAAQTNQLCEPDAISFTSVINAWSKSLRPDAPKRATKILHAMENYNSEKAKINVVTLTAVMECWANSGQPNAQNHADAILKRMKELSVDRPELRPNIVSFNMCMLAWTRSGHSHSPERVEELFQELKAFPCKPDERSYLTRLSCWEYQRKSNPQKAAVYCTKILEEMIKDAAVYPRQKHFNRVLVTLADAGGYQQAEQILQHMLDDYLKRDIETSAPDSFSFSNVMRAWSNGAESHRQAAEQCEALLLRMHKVDAVARANLKPSLVVYNTTLAAWAKSGAVDGYERARKLMETMKRQGVSPDAYSYMNLFKCLARGKSEGKEEVTAEILAELKASNVKANEYIELVQANGLFFTRTDGRRGGST